MPSDQLLASSTEATESGFLIGQRVEFSGSKNIAKAALDINLVQDYYRAYFTSVNDSFVFFAPNFQESKHVWAFQPYIYPDFLTSHTPITNTLQPRTYTTDNDVLENAPMLQYLLYMPEGVYNLWGYAYANGEGVGWQFNDGSLNRTQIGIGNPEPAPYWTKIGTIEITETSLNTFSVFLINKDDTVILDEWAFVKSENEDEELTIASLETEPSILVSDGPFVVATRLRALVDGDPADLTTTENITGWLSSTKIFGSGKSNFIFQQNENNRGITFTDGLCIEYWQIGGNNYSNFAAWDYSFVTSSIGNTYTSTDFGQSINNSTG